MKNMAANARMVTKNLVVARVEKSEQDGEKATAVWRGGGQWGQVADPMHDCPLQVLWPRTARTHMIEICNGY